VSVRDRVESIDRVFRCDRCASDQRVEVVYRETADGGEAVILRCLTCATEYPSAYVTARGLRVRDQLVKARSRKPSAARDRDVARLEAAMQREVRRAYDVPVNTGEASDARSVGSDRRVDRGGVPGGGD
jgi:hypothetical protein